jgi:hypothetical protein
VRVLWAAIDRPAKILNVQYSWVWSWHSNISRYSEAKLGRCRNVCAVVDIIQGLREMPRLVYQPTPAYPEEARQQG